MMTFITRIAEENYEYYLPMLPEDFTDWMTEDESMLMFGIEYHGEAAGAVMLRRIAFEAEFTWFYVDEEFRGRGVGTEAMTELSRILYKDYGMRFLAMNIYAGADPYLKQLFKGLPVSRRELPQCCFETTLGWLLSSERIRPKYKNCISLAELDKKKLNLLSDDLIAHGEDLVNMPIDKEDYLKEQSAVYIEEERAKGVLLFSKQGAEIEISLMASFADSATALMNMMSFSAQKLKRFGEDTLIRMNIVDKRIIMLIKNLLGMDKDDNEGFTYSERLILNLSYVGNADRQAKRMLDMWDVFDRKAAS